MCLPGYLCAQIARTPFNYTITARTLLGICNDYQFQRLILQFPALGKNYPITSTFIITRKLSTPQDVARRESGSMFRETNHFQKFEPNRVESMKTSRWKVTWANNEIHSSRSGTNSISPVSLFAPHHLRSVI